MPRRKNWRQSVSRREVVGKEVSKHASPVLVQANESPVQLIAGKWKSCPSAGNAKMAKQ